MVILNSKKFIDKHSKEKHFFNLPTHLLANILVRVASTSLIDLFNAKLTCREWFKAASDDWVFERASMDSLSISLWKKKTSKSASSFVKKCIKVGNPEALFRQGMMDYFTDLKVDSGLEYLRKASDKGNVEAKYVYCIILVCSGGEYRIQSLKLGSELKSESIVKLCREKVRKVVKFMWLPKFIVGEGEEEELRMRRKNCSLCASFVEMKKKSMGWTDEEEFDDGVSCDGCLWDNEAIRFRHMLRTGRFSCRFVN